MFLSSHCVWKGTRATLKNHYTSQSTACIQPAKDNQWVLILTSCISYLTTWDNNVSPCQPKQRWTVVFIWWCRRQTYHMYMESWTNVDLRLGRRLKRWANIESALVQRISFAVASCWYIFFPPRPYMMKVCQYVKQRASHKSVVPDQRERIAQTTLV